jgi:hypothetical protein
VQQALRLEHGPVHGRQGGSEARGGNNWMLLSDQHFVALRDCFPVIGLLGLIRNRADSKLARFHNLLS